jgi:hypothetical protein
MSEYMFGVTYTKPSRKDAKRFDRICRDEGGYGFTEVNVRADQSQGVNNGRYQGWFTGPNYGAPFDDHLRDRVLERAYGQTDGRA